MSGLPWDHPDANPAADIRAFADLSRTTHHDGQITGGVYQLRHRHATSEMIPFDAPVEEVQAAFDRMHGVDMLVQRQHDEDPELARECPVCSPEYACDVRSTTEVLTLRGRVNQVSARIGYRLRRLWWAATSDIEEDWYGY